VAKKRGSWIISASGGVQVDSWLLADKPEANESLAPLRKTAAAAADAWWWN
jgi:hypothetical protein